MTAKPEAPPELTTDPVVLARWARRKWIVFGSLFAFWFAADILSKNWADATLATPYHPKPIRITEAEAGKTLGAVMQERLGWEDAELATNIAAKVERLAPAGAYSGDAKPFNREGPAQGVSGFFVFWRGDLEAAPRRIDRLDQNRLSFWLGMAFPKADKAEVNKVAYDHVAELTFAEWMPEVFRKLSPEDVAELAAEKRIHPIDPPGLAVAGPRPDDVVAVGQDYLLTDHEIPVMGTWFKFVYAENPGAAFGFLKGVSPGIRSLMFMILTLIAFVVIGVIVKRLPVHGWLVAACFGSILAGAAGNFVDRIRFGYVIDFIDMTLGSLNWPTYNVADIAISVGVVALMLDLLFNKKSLMASKKDKEKAAAKKAAAST